MGLTAGEPTRRFRTESQRADQATTGAELPNPGVQSRCSIPRPGKAMVDLRGPRSTVRADQTQHEAAMSQTPMRRGLLPGN
jgi:hypothetical protein